MATDTESQPGTDKPGPASERRKEAVDKAADAYDGNGQPDPTQISEREAQDGTDWFMSDETESTGYLDFELNVANEGEKWVRFRVGALTRERIEEIREQNTVTKSDGTLKTNAIASNTRIGAEGLLVPNLKEAKTRVVKGQQYIDPADALAARFAHKPGLIDQIANKISDVSGYNTDDVREVRAAKS